MSAGAWVNPAVRWGQAFGAPHPGEWIFEANCATTDPEVFFPERGGSSRDAIGVCQKCPVIESCLDYALRYGTDGVWGGRSENQRKLLRRQRRQEAN